jgi:hypothetical protein
METNQNRRIILLNAFPLSAFPARRLVVEFRRITLQELRELSNSGADVINYIRHPSTVSIVAQALGRQLEPFSGTYSYSQGDIVVIAVLNQPQRGQEVQQVQPEDLLLYQLTVHELV